MYRLRTSFRSAASTRVLSAGGARRFRSACSLVRGNPPEGCLEPHQPVAANPQPLGLGLLDDAVDTLAVRRVQDAAAAEPEGDVIGLASLRVRDQVAGAEVVLGELRAGLLLLVGVARHPLAGPAEGDVDEAGAVDPALRQAAPLVRHPEKGARLGQGIAAQ